MKKFFLAMILMTISLSVMAQHLTFADMEALSKKKNYSPISSYMRAKGYEYLGTNSGDLVFGRGCVVDNDLGKFTGLQETPYTFVTVCFFPDLSVKYVTVHTNQVSFYNKFKSTAKTRGFVKYNEELHDGSIHIFYKKRNLVFVAEERYDGTYMVNYMVLK